MNKVESTIAVILAVLFIVAISVYGATIPKYGEENAKKSKWNTFFGWILIYIRVAMILAVIALFVYLAIKGIMKL